MKNPAISYRVLRADIKPCGHRMDKIYLVPIPLLILALSACSQAPIVHIQYVNVPTYIPIPATLTQPISVGLTGATWGSAVGSLNAGLETCNSQLQAISTLKPSPPR